MKRLAHFLDEEAGAELAEYAVAIALLVAIASVVYLHFADAIAFSNSSTASAIDNVGGSFTPSP